MLKINFNLILIFLGIILTQGYALELGLGVHTSIELAQSSLQAHQGGRKVSLDGNFNSLQPAWQIGASLYLHTQPWLFFTPSFKMSLFRHIRSEGETAMTTSFQLDVSGNLKIGYWFIGLGLGVNFNLKPQFLSGFPLQGEQTKGYVGAILLLQSGAIFPVDAKKHHNVSLSFTANFDLRSFATQSLTIDEIHRTMEDALQFSFASPVVLSLNVGYVFIF